MTEPRRPDVSRRGNPAFGELVTRLTDGRPLREIWELTGVSHTRIGDMRRGIVPSYAVLREFADGLEAHGLLTMDERGALFRTAGYADKSVTSGIPPPPDEEAYDARTYWHALMSALRISFGVESVRVSLCGGEPDPDTPPEVLDARYQRIRDVLIAERDIERVKS